MTAVPDHEAGTVHLICDRCGELLAASGSKLRDPELVWPLLAEYGWTGSPFLTGSHQCPACRSAAPEGGEPLLPAAPGTTTPWRASVARVRGAVVVTPQADISPEVTEQFRRCLAEALGIDRHIVLNMGRARTLSPPALAVLVRAHSEAKRRGGALCLVAPSRFVLTALHTMRLDPVFPRFGDSWGALAWLDAGKPMPPPGTPPPGGADPVTPAGDLAVPTAPRHGVVPTPSQPAGVAPYLEPDSDPAPGATERVGSWP